MSEKYSPKPERENKAISNHDKFEIILKLFGNQKSRESFLDICKKYNDIRKSQRASEILGESASSSSHSRRDTSPPKRSMYHNQIMDTLKRLSLQKLNDQQKSIIYEMASRDTTARIIHDYLMEEEDADDDDEFNNPRDDSSSDVAYFHSLGKGE